MAKKQQKGKGQQKAKQPSGLITNLPMKGMVKDTHASYLDSKNWTHARNAINNSVDGDTGVVGNEPANLLCAEIPYTVIGGIHLYGDKWIIFSTDNSNELNNGSSEIGEFDDSTCTYTTLVNDDCLNFHKDNLCIGVSKENFDCSWQIYWDDGRNPSRTLNLDNIPYKQYVTSAPGAACTVYSNITPLQLDCEKIRLAPLLDTPVIKLSKANEGGQLANGMYQVFIAYSVNDQIVGDYLGVSNLQSLWSHQNNQGSLNVEISNVDKEFEFMQVVVRARVNGGFGRTCILGFYSTETTSINIDYLDPDLEKIKSSKLLLRNPAYEKSSGMFEVNDYLIRTQPTEQFDFNYQPLANNIVTEWVSARYPAEYYKEGGNKPTFLRDEVYTFFIRFIYNTGEKSKAYHIPGRAAAGNELSTDTSGNSWDGVAKVFKTTNTASYTGTLAGNLPDGGVLTGYGNMGYWESTEKYPATDSTRYAALCGMPIRHHKMPDENTNVVTRLGTDATGSAGCTEDCGTHINIIGVQFSNIAAPQDNQGNIITNIVGYEMLVGNRDGNKSIIAKGIIRNMQTYERFEHVRSIQAGSGTNYFNPLDEGEGPRSAALTDLSANTPNPTGQTDIRWGLIPNYPYNDLGIDPYLIYRGNGDLNTAENPWFAGLFGGDPVESNWITGRGSLIRPTEDATIHMSQDNRGMNEFTRDFHTFHSPDLNFTHMYLNPSSMVVYKTLVGKAEGQFKKSEKHPGAKLLKNKAVLVAAIIGVGYALNHMRGKRNVKINTARSQSTGETMAVGSGMTPMPGTGTAAAAVNVLLNLPGVVVGAVADMAFNTVVDVASVFGAGKLARQIGTPIYQMIETGTTGLMAGHIGPNKTIEYIGSDFTSTPTLFSMVTGILTFLNFVAIGGDKIIDLILKLVDFQDYAWKYNSHGFYDRYVPFASGNCIGGQGMLAGACTSVFRHQVNRARYIKPGIQYMNGNVAINNLHRPSTVVINTNTLVDSPGNWNNLDDSKFVIGGGQCAGDGNHQLSWWTPTGLATSNIAAHYVGLKLDNDAQYGQLDSILFTPMAHPIKFADSATDIDTNTRFSTGPMFGGDTYISRYTEKVTMPFWFDFMGNGGMEMPDGTPWDYRFYSNVPFPRYWMNTEKYRMDEFVRPITNLSFNFDNAFPSDMYHLDQPTDVDCDALGYNNYTDNGGGDVANYFEDANFHLQVIQIPTSDNIVATLSNRIKAPTWEIAGVGKSQMINHPGEDCTWYTAAGYTCPENAQVPQEVEPARKREVAIGIQGRHKSHRHSTPLIDWSGGSCISSGKDDWYDFANPGNDVTPPRTTDIDGQVRPFKALYNWNEGKFMYPVLNTVPTGIIGDPGYANTCNHNGFCTIGGTCFDAAGNTTNFYTSATCIANGTCSDPQYNTGVCSNPNFFTQAACTNGGGAWTTAQARCTAAGETFTANTWTGTSYVSDSVTTRRDCLLSAGTWTDSCVPEDDPRHFIFFSRAQRKKEKGWFSGTIKLDQGSFNINGDANGPNQGGTDAAGVSAGNNWTDCDGAGARFCRPGDDNRSTGLDPDNCFRNVHQLVTKGGAPPKTSDIGSDRDKYSDKDKDGNRKTGGLFVEKLGYMYTHNSGIQDFFVESDMNLSFRDWEDQPRKRHYDYTEYTDIHELFDVAHISGDNYYKYDPSLNIRRFWTASFGKIQPRWYDPTVSETCFTKYPKRLLYSLPSTGVHTKEMQQHKNDERADHWRTFLPENFRDFKSRVNTIVPTNKTGAIILFPTLSPQLFQGVDQIKLSGSANKLTIGDGGLFSQAFQSITNSDVSHEYGSCESARSVISTPSGMFFVSQAQGKIFQYGGKGLTAISDLGMKWWFNQYLPSQLLKAFPQIENSPSIIDNPVVSAGVQSVYDPMNDIVYFSKRDYKPHSDKVSNISIVPDTDGRLRFMYSDPVVQQSVEINVTDSDYFEDCSWTVSFDPKAKAWISFHDWHPELAFNSINHFLTTKKGISSTPICPPGYTYNGATQLCEIQAVGSEAATVTTDSVLASNSFTGNTSCKLDIVISMDSSGSTGTPDDNTDQAYAEVEWLKSFIDHPDIQAGLTANTVQIGLVSWSSNTRNWMNTADTTNAPASTLSMSSNITSADAANWFEYNWFGGGTNVANGLSAAETLLDNKTDSSLGDRTSQSDFKQIIILVTDTTSAPPSGTGDPYQSVGIGNGTHPLLSGGGSQEVYALFAGVNSATPSNASVLSLITSTNGPATTSTNISTGDPYQYGIAVNDAPSTWDTVANAIAGQSCNPPVQCNCPAGYISVGPCDAFNTPTCVKDVCSCANAPGFALGLVTETGVCGDVSNPLMCNYNFSDTSTPNYDIAGIWRHNVRTDKFANFYGNDYPWEIDLLQTTGQTVTTLRSVEYSLESFVYKNEGRDRFHVLDFNFDEAEIYNSEQTSGLLKLDLSPKNNVPLITTYPIINANDISILYSKEEQKYRFNQFWDVTNDRGEFSNAENTIYLTRINGYIRDLNMANINLLKSSFERKKFRHYYNHVVLRRLVSNDKKMLLRLENTKLNPSMR